MSTAIQQIIVSSIPDNRVILGNAQMAAPLITPFDDWQSLVIGIRYTVTDSGANLASGTRSWIGFMSDPAAGLTNGPLTNNTSHFLGTGHMNSLAYTRNAGPPVRYRVSSSVWSACRRVGSTNTVLGTVGNSVVYSAQNDLRLLLFVYVFKGSPNWTIGRVAFQSNDAPVDFSLAQLKNALNLTSQTDVRDYCNSIAGAGRYTNTSGILAVNEPANGTINAVVLGWNTTDSLFQVSDVFVAKWA